VVCGEGVHVRSPKGSGENRIIVSLSVWILIVDNSFLSIACPNMYTYTHTHTHTQKHTNTHTHTHTHVYTYIHPHVYTCMHIATSSGSLSLQHSLVPKFQVVTACRKQLLQGSPRIRPHYYWSSSCNSFRNSF
jgi:hypothetical protein